MVDAEVGLLGNLITAGAQQKFVAGREIRRIVEWLDNNNAIHGRPDVHFVLKEDGARVKECVVSYKGNGLARHEQVAGFGKRQGRFEKLPMGRNAATHPPLAHLRCLPLKQQQDQPPTVVTAREVAR
ncbi:hypothetical protein [Polymorphobacter multimanifer]|uniref:hypothetical protein n=1 Tax=Polymorphobacter multimanifer TaxID=1070431 RepID=UPI001622462B|nr:hypothetical protein [Polymorphobacter multimanifer]